MFLNKKVMRKLFSRLIVKIVTMLSLTSLVQAAQFDLPLRMPGKGNRKQQMDTNHIKYETIIISNDCSVYFPSNDSQPTTGKAGEYSGATEK